MPSRKTPAPARFDHRHQLTASPEWWHRLDAWIAKQSVPPSRSAAIRVAVDRMLKAEEQKKRGR